MAPLPPICHSEAGKGVLENRAAHKIEVENCSLSCLRTLEFANTSEFDFEFTQADEWTYYYPGKSHLFIVAVTRDAIRRLRKALSN